MNIYVGNLSYDTTDDDLRKAFEAHGKIDSAHVVIDKYTDRSRGFGFVEMPDDGEGKNAIAKMNGASLQGRDLRVNEARPREERAPRSSGPRGGGDNYR